MPLYKWRVTDQITGKRYVARYYMTEPDALKLDPSAEKVPGSEYEPRPVYDSHHHQRLNTTPVTAMTYDEKEAYEERAAIMEYEAGMTRREAERKAMELIRGARNETNR